VLLRSAHYALLLPASQVILAEDTLAASTGQLVAIKVLKRQHALAGQRVGATLAPLPAITYHHCCMHFYLPLLLPNSDLQSVLIRPGTPGSFKYASSAWWVLLQEARALRYLHAAAPSGTAPGVVRLLDCFTLGAHYCLVTGGCLAGG
jgi:hypothetical protein